MAVKLDCEIVLRYGNKEDGSRGWMASCRCYICDDSVSPARKGEDSHALDISGIQSWLDSMRSDRMVEHGASE